MTNHYWDRVTAPHAAAVVSPGAFIETGPERWPFGLDSAAALVARVAWPNEAAEAQSRWSGRLINEPNIRAATEHLARRRFESALAALRGIEDAHCEGHGGPGRWYCCQHPDAGWPCPETVEDQS